MDWQRPDFVEIDMNAEIGAYQQDRDGGDPDRAEYANERPVFKHACEA